MWVLTGFTSTITLTRKLFTMLLSVVVYNHKLTPGQWLGAGVVFAGISVEAWVKRKGLFVLFVFCCVQRSAYGRISQMFTQSGWYKRKRRLRSRLYNYVVRCYAVARRAYNS